MNLIETYFNEIIFDLEGNSEYKEIEEKNKSQDEILKEINYHDNYDNLNIIKDKINFLSQKEWDFLKKKNNPFEAITANYGIANYSPISRAYFKMTEILYHLRVDILEVIKNTNDNLVTLHLAEGPGGFIECINSFLEQEKINNYKMYGITLVKDEKNIPGWKKFNFFLDYYKHIQILYGKNGTGDLYDIENIYDVQSKICSKAFLITADGGFDYSNDFNQQENLSFPLIYCQTLTALLCQRIGGIFILKIFDIYNKKTICLLNILKKNYKVVKVIKPYTSRPGNSEKYIVCLHFLNKITDEEIHKLLLDISKIGINNSNNNLEIYKYSSLDYEFLNSLKKINDIFFERQKKFILDSLELNNPIVLENKKESLIKNQILISTYWCKLYNFKINFLSKYFFINS